MNLGQKILAGATLISTIGIGSCSYDKGEKKSEEVKKEYSNPKIEFDSGSLNQISQDIKAYNEILSLSNYEAALSENDSLENVINSQSQKINSQREYIESLEGNMVAPEIESEREYISNLENRIDSLKKLINEPKSRNTWSFIIPYSQSEIDSKFKDLDKDKYVYTLEKLAERIEIKDDYIRTLEKDLEKLKENPCQDQ